MPDIIIDSKREIEPFFKFSRLNIQKYGNIYAFNLAFFNRLAILSPDHLSDIYGSKSSNYIKGEIVIDALGPIVGNGLVVSEGNLWKHQRHTINPAFLGSNIDKMVPLMIMYTDDMLKKWKNEIINSNKNNIKFELHEKFSNLTLDMIAGAAFGGAFHDDPNIQKVIYEAFNIVGPQYQARIQSLIGFIPYLKNLPTPGKQKIDAAAGAIASTVLKIIVDRSNGLSKALLDRDLLDMLLDSRYDHDGNETMSLKQIRDECMTFVLAGHETSSNLLSWFFYEVSKDQSIWKMLMEEINDVLKGEKLNSENIKGLVKLNSTLQETLRYWPPAPLIFREAINTHTIGEKSDRPIKIEKGTSILTNTFLLHRDPTLWENPETFEPLRFTRATEHGKRRHIYQYMPFGGGKRLCIGVTFALTEATIIAAMVMQNFHFNLSDNQVICPHATITMKPRYGVYVDATLN